ncbi:MAG: HIT domain-containing protein [Planctomycetota bacterium]
MTDPIDNPNPGGPDNVWAPWRLQYLESFADDEHNREINVEPAPDASGGPPGAAAAKPAEPASFFETYWAHPERDAEHHVVVRTDDGMVLLNKYPYANGHLLVALGKARPRLLDYSPEQRGAFWGLVDRATDLMERALAPQGINTGINQGRAAGAGIPIHLHAHLVPRWGGDVNFITTVGQTRVIPGSLDAMWERYVRVLGAD